MRLLYKTLLTTCCLPFALYSMDKAPDTTPITSETKTALISQTYNAAYPKLKKYAKENLESRRDLIEIIGETNTLRKQGISEEELSSFAFKQTTALFDEFLDQISDAPFNKGHLYVGVFFERLRHYNNNIKKNDLVSPTWEQYLAYRHNKQIQKTVAKAAKFHVYINLDKLYATSNPLMPIENGENTATKEFDELITDVSQMRNQELKEVQRLASLLCGIHK